MAIERADGGALQHGAFGIDPKTVGMAPTVITVAATLLAVSASTQRSGVGNGNAIIAPCKEQAYVQQC